MSLLDYIVIGSTAFIILYCVYGYFKEEAELPKYEHDVNERDEHSAQVAEIRA